MIVRALLLALLVLPLCACATAPVPAPPAVVSGNGHCHPAADLPAHKAMKKLAETDTFMDDLFAAFLGERKDHAADIADYNSLYATCVEGK